MQYRNKNGLRFLCFVLVLINLSTPIVVADAPIHSRIQPDKHGRQASIGQVSGQTSTSEPKQSKDSSSGNNIRKLEDSEYKSDLRLSKSLQKKRRQALSLLEAVLTTSYRVSPPEHRILAEVEAATLLWRIDNERALSILKDAFSRLRELFETGQESQKTDRAAARRRERIRFLILRKVAAIKPDLVNYFSIANPSGKAPEKLISGEWTDEARAIMSLALDQVDKDPKAAARLAEQSIPLGYTDWESFMIRLSQRDQDEAERLATILMNRLRDSSITPITFQNLKRFVFRPDRSSRLREHFFQSSAIRLRRAIRPDATIEELEDSLIAAREFSQLAAASHPNWQAEFESIAGALELIFKERSVALPGSRTEKILDPSMLDVAPNDTQGITDLLPKVAALTNPQERDEQYQKLATKAALSADLSLASHIISKIDNEQVRSITTFTVYSPLVMKAIKEADFSQAQKYASEILDPLGRTLIHDKIAQAASRSGEDRYLVKSIYRIAAARLEHEWSTEDVAKAFLIIAKSLSPIDKEGGIDAIKSAITVLNRLAAKREPLGQSTIRRHLATWVSLPNFSVNPDEALDITEMIGFLFKEMAKSGAEEALLIADGLADLGLHSLARLAIVRCLFEEINSSSGSTPRRITGHR